MSYFRMSLAPTVVLAFVLTTACAKPGNVVPVYSPEQQELLSLSDKWNQALAQKDRAVLEELLSDSFYIAPPGELEKVERAEWLRNAQEMDWRDLKFRNSKVDIYGDTAVVTSLLDFKVTSKSGIPIITDSQVIDVWTKRDGRWQVAARHLGEYSMINKGRTAVGFAAGLILCGVIWVMARLRRRFKKKAAEAAL